MNTDDILAELAELSALLQMYEEHRDHELQPIIKGNGSIGLLVKRLYLGQAQLNAISDKLDCIIHNLEGGGENG